MRIVFSITALLVATVAMFATSCKKDTPIAPPADEIKSPTIALDIYNIGSEQIEFSVTTTDTEEAYYYCVEGTTEPSTESIKSEGVLLTQPQNSVVDLTPNTQYTLYALAVNGSKQAIAKESFTTLAEAEKPFDGYELNKLVSAVYRNDNEALAGNYELSFGNTTELGWVGDVQLFIDFYNSEDSDPLNPVLPSGIYEPNSDFSPFSYNPSNSYVDIVVEGGELVTSPIMGLVTVERTGATYTITVEGTLMLLDDMAFSARYTGSIQFVQGGTSAYEFFDKDVTIDFDEAQMRYWGGWFYPFCDDVGVEMFDGEFDEYGSLQKGYYLHLSRVFMSKYGDYNAEFIPLASGEYFAASSLPTTPYCMPYLFETGAVTDYFGDKYFIGTYLQYVENGQVKRVGLVTGGSMVVESSAGGTKVTMNFVTDNGVNLTLSFDGEFAFGNFNDNDETMPLRPWTTLDSDHTYNFPAETEGYAFCLGEHMTEGYDNWMLMIYAQNEDNPGGYGDMFTTEFIVASGGSRNVLPTGTYNVSLDVADHTMFTGFIEYAGAIIFTWYGDLTPDAEGYSSETAPITSGTVTVEDAGEGNYHFIFDLVDDGGNKITGEWSGRVTAEDISEAVSGESSGAPRPLALRN